MYFADGESLARIHCDKCEFPEFTQNKGERYNWRDRSWVEDRMIGSYIMFKANYYEQKTPREIYEIIANRDGWGVEAADRAMNES